MRRAYSAILLAGLLAACGISEADVQATIAALPTQTPIPSPTRTSTSTPRPTIAPTSTQPSALGTRSNPYPLGYSGIFEANAISFSLRVAEVVRGEEAWQQLVSRYRSNRPPAAGMEYVLVSIEVKAISGPANNTLDLWRYDFEWLANNQIMDFYTSDAKFAVAPNPEFDVSLFPGGTAKGWLAILVPSNTRGPALILGRSANSQGFYFSLEN